MTKNSSKLYHSLLYYFCVLMIHNRTVKLLLANKMIPVSHFRQKLSARQVFGIQQISFLKYHFQVIKVENARLPNRHLSNDYQNEFLEFSKTFQNLFFTLISNIKSQKCPISENYFFFSIPDVHIDAFFILWNHQFTVSTVIVWTSLSP